jgi:phosphoserine phosphatase
MKKKSLRGQLFTALALLGATAHSLPALAQDPLPSWNDGATKSAIVAFVESATAKASPAFVPVAERIAVFDNDGTLWSEQPAYFQLFYAIDYIQQHADEHPEWRTTQPFKAAIEGDLRTLAAGGEEGLVKLVMASHAGMTNDEFHKSVGDFIASARHPTKKKLYNELVYQPMLELMDYLRDNEFQTWIVSGGGIDFMRVFTEETYGIPPEQVVGSQIEMGFEMQDGKPVIVRQPKINFIDDKAGKPVGIERHIGRKPVAAFGNSDGDLQMLQYTCVDRPGTLCLIVHHTDATREWAYDRDSHIGELDAALTEAEGRDWVVVDMAKDWEVVYPFELKAD